MFDVTPMVATKTSIDYSHTKNEKGITTKKGNQLDRGRE